MKRKEVIYAVAFHGIPVDRQVNGEVESGGIVMKPGTRGNIELACASLIKECLENATPDIHDDAPLTTENYQALQQALEEFRDMTLETMLIPQLRAKTEDSFDAQIKLLQEMQRKSTGEA